MRRELIAFLLLCPACLAATNCGAAIRLHRTVAAKGLTAVTSVSKDTALVGDDKGRIYLFSLDARKLGPAIQTGFSSITDLAVSPDGRYAVVIGNKAALAPSHVQHVEMWDLSSKTRAKEWDVNKGGGTGLCPAFAPDGHALVIHRSVYTFRSSPLSVKWAWDLDSYPEWVAYSPDSTKLVLSGQKRTDPSKASDEEAAKIELRLVDASDEPVILKMEGMSSGPVAFSQDSSLLAASWSKQESVGNSDILTGRLTVGIYCGQRLVQMLTLKGDYREVKSLFFSRDGRYLVTVCSPITGTESVAHVFNIKDGKQVASQPLGDEVWSAAPTSSDTFVTASYNSCKLWRFSGE